jgi:hypothetical protein
MNYIYSRIHDEIPPRLTSPYLTWVLDAPTGVEFGASKYSGKPIGVGVIFARKDGAYYECEQVSKQGRNPIGKTISAAFPLDVERQIDVVAAELQCSRQDVMRIAVSLFVGAPADTFELVD